MGGTEQIHSALLVPELAEVYLLLDHISAVATARLPDLNADPVFAGEGKPTWVQQICDIRWPPTPAQPQDEALNATKLLRAKDALNAVAHPASGMSVAFTLLMSGEAGGSPGWRRRWARLLDGDAHEEPRFINPRDRLCSGQPMSRMSLAAIAYPGLNRAKRLYRSVYYCLNAFLLLALVVTCYLSWTVATGSSMLNRVSALGAMPEQRVPRDAGSKPGSAETRLQGDSAHQLAYDTAVGNLGRFVDANPHLAALIGGRSQATRVHSSIPGQRFATVDVNLEWAAIFIGVLAGTVLPIAYGVLGASAAVVRNTAARMNFSTLTPRALILAVVQLGLGAVIGACVGLFVNADGNGATDGQGLFGTVRLSGSALCFLAGFGVEGVFRALEALVKRVFPTGSTPVLPAQVIAAPTIPVPTLTETARAGGGAVSGQTGSQNP